MTASMNQAFKPLHGTLTDGLFVLAGKWAIGATGAVGTQTRGSGLRLTRTGVGAYTLQLRHNAANARCVAILHPSVRLLVNDADPTNDTDGHYIKLKAISDSAGTVTFQCEDETGAVAEAPSGAVITVALFGTVSSVVR